jgi:hypothetical protein
MQQVWPVDPVLFVAGSAIGRRCLSFTMSSNFSGLRPSSVVQFISSVASGLKSGEISQL